jgi:hypothetical protein
VTSRGSLIAVCALAAALMARPALLAVAIRQNPVARISWADTAPLRSHLAMAGITAASFQDYVQRTHDENLRRVREGDLDHLVFYLLQSTRFTSLAPIEPAISARTLVESLDPPQRDEFLKKSRLDVAKVPAPVRSRIAALERAFDKPEADARLRSFRDLVAEAVPKGADMKAALASEYLRAMRFVYQKEFVAQRTERPAEAVADLYRTRGLSTDTAV